MKGLVHVQKGRCVQKCECRPCAPKCVNVCQDMCVHAHMYVHISDKEEIKVYCSFVFYLLKKMFKEDERQTSMKTDILYSSMIYPHYQHTPHSNSE